METARIDMRSEIAGVDFGSKRLDGRFKKVISDLSEQPDKSIWLASGSRANAKAVYRMLSNEKYRKESILTAHRESVNGRNEENMLLAVQGTMSVTYAGHEKTESMGYNCEKKT